MLTEASTGHLSCSLPSLSLFLSAEVSLFCSAELLGLVGVRLMASSVSIRGDVRGDIFFFFRCLLVAGSLSMNFGPSIPLSLVASGVTLEASGVFSLLEPPLHEDRTYTCGGRH